MMCAHCREDISIAQPTGNGWLYKHDNGGYTLCIIDGSRPGCHAEPAK